MQRFMLRQAPWLQCARRLRCREASDRQVAVQTQWQLRLWLVDSPTCLLSHVLTVILLSVLKIRFPGMAITDPLGSKVTGPIMSGGACTGCIYGMAEQRVGVYV